MPRMYAGLDGGFTGMVYIALEELGWRPAVQTWAALALPKEVPDFKDPALLSVAPTLSTSHLPILHAAATPAAAT